MKPHTSTKPTAVVIGSGFGGLAAAVRLIAKGYDVRVLEKNASPGGRAVVRHRQGFVFDSGPTVITAPFLFEELWSLLGERMDACIDLRPVSPFYRVRFHDGSVFDYTGDAQKMRAEVAKFSPSDVAGYERFVRTSEAIFQVGFEQLAHVPFDSWWDMAKIVPQMVRLQSYRTVYQLVSRYIKNDKLRQVMSFHPLLVGGNPFSTTSIYTLIAFLERKWGVHFPIGGTGSLVSGLVELIQRHGGHVQCDAEVERIVVKDRRAVGVVLKKEKHLVPADIVVSNADAAWTYRFLIEGRDRKKWTDARVDRARFSMGLYVWYFGTDRIYPDVAHHTILLGPRYKGLLDDIFERKVLSEDFSLYLHRPTATDPGLAPPGKDTFYVLSPVPNLQARIDWKAQRQAYQEAIKKFLGATILPDLDRHLVVSEDMTPMEFQNDLFSYQGAAFGFEPVLTQSAYFRPHNKSEDVKGLFLVGAGTHPGAGMPGVLSSARVLDSVVPSLV